MLHLLEGTSVYNLCDCVIPMENDLQLSNKECRV